MSSTACSASSLDIEVSSDTSAVLSKYDPADSEVTGDGVGGVGSTITFFANRVYYQHEKNTINTWRNTHRMYNSIDCYRFNSAYTRRNRMYGNGISNCYSECSGLCTVFKNSTKYLSPQKRP